MAGLADHVVKGAAEGAMQPCMVGEKLYRYLVVHEFEVHVGIYWWFHGIVAYD